MSLEDRFRQALADAMSEVKTRLETEFEAAVTDVKAEAERDHSAALAVADDAQAHLKADADATVEAIRVELRAAQAAVVARREEFEQTLARTQSEHENLQQDLRKALEAATQARDEHAAEAARLREESATIAARLHAEFEAATSQARLLAESALATLRTEARESASLHSQAVDAHQTGALRLLESVRTLDGSTSLTEVLDALTIGASREAGRAAMLVVKGDRLIGWRTIGFGALDREARAIESSTSDAGALAAAVNTGRSAMVGSGSALAAPSFSDAPADRPGQAVPLLVAGRPVAVLYADPGASSGATGWTSPVEVLVRHAARCLEGLAVHRATAPRAASARVGAPA